MSEAWKMSDAVSHFDELVAQTLAAGPQTVTDHGKPVVVVVAAEEFAESEPADLLSCLRRCPGAELAEALDEFARGPKELVSDLAFPGL